MPTPRLNRSELTDVKLVSLLEDVQARMLNATRCTQELASSPAHNVSLAVAYHLRSGGQQVRAKLALSAALSLGIQDSDAVCLAACAELLHNASLVHDDLQDGDLFRRGQPTLWSKYGENFAVCCGDLLLSASYGVLCQLTRTDKLPAVLDMVHQRTSRAIAGQCADLSALDSHTDLVDQYIAIAKAKSGALLGLPLELGLLVAGYPESISVAKSAADHFAVGYQIIDDLQDHAADSKRTSQQQRVPPPALNIVLLLEQQSGHDDPFAQASALAIDHLKQCEDFALQLPHQSGLLLISYCTKMRTTLNDTITQFETY
jgi:geranylgeranyl pyrophosphate synthase